MALNARRLDRSKKLSEGGGNNNFLKLKNGKTHLRVFAFKHEVEDEDFDKGIYKKSDGIKVGEEYDEVERVCYIHFTEDGIENCIRKDCPICEKSEEYLTSKDKEDQKLGKDLRANKRFYLNVVDMGNVDKGMQLCPLPGSVFNTILEYLMDPEYGEEILGCKGRDFIIDRDTSLEPSKMYGVRLRDANRCEELDESLQDTVVDLFKLKMLDPGWSANSEESAPARGSKRDEKPAREETRKPSKPAAKKPEPEDDDEEVEPLKSKAKEKPSPAGKSKPADDDDEELPPNDLEDEDTEPERRKGERAAKAPASIPKWIVKGEMCCFKNGKVTEVGTITAINVDKGEVEVETDTSMWDLSYAEIEPYEKPAAPAGKPKQRR